MLAGLYSPGRAVKDVRLCEMYVISAEAAPIAKKGSFSRMARFLSRFNGQKSSSSNISGRGVVVLNAGNMFVFR